MVAWTLTTAVWLLLLLLMGEEGRADAGKCIVKFCHLTSDLDSHMVVVHECSFHRPKIYSK